MIFSKTKLGLASAGLSLSLFCAPSQAGCRDFLRRQKEAIWPESISPVELGQLRDQYESMFQSDTPLLELPQRPVEKIAAVLAGLEVIDHENGSKLNLEDVAKAFRRKLTNGLMERTEVYAIAAKLLTLAFPDPDRSGSLMARSRRRLVRQEIIRAYASSDDVLAEGGLEPLIDATPTPRTRARIPYFRVLGWTSIFAATMVSDVLLHRLGFSYSDFCLNDFLIAATFALNLRFFSAYRLSSQATQSVEKGDLDAALSLTGPEVERGRAKMVQWSRWFKKIVIVSLLPGLGFAAWDLDILISNLHTLNDKKGASKWVDDHWDERDKMLQQQLDEWIEGCPHTPTEKEIKDKKDFFWSHQKELRLSAQ